MAHIIRPMDQVRAVRDIYEFDRNVVGIDIQQKILASKKYLIQVMKILQGL